MAGSRNGILFEGERYPDALSYVGLQHAADRSRGYGAAYEGLPDSTLMSDAWRTGWAAFQKGPTNHDTPRPTDADAICDRRGNDGGLSPRLIRGEHRSPAIADNLPVSPEVPTGSEPAVVPLDAADQMQSEVQHRTGDGVGQVKVALFAPREESRVQPALPSMPAIPSLPFVQCGIVCVIDFLNLFHRAWHAGEPSDIHAVRSMFDTIGDVIDRFSPEFVIFAMDGGYTHRTKLYPAYKSSREAKPPELLKQIALGERAIQAIGFPSIRVEGFEADDVLASLAKQLDGISATTILVTSDKDALQICSQTRAKAYHPWQGGKVITEAICDEKHGVPFSMMNGFLALRGDVTDDVPGVDRIGDKTAALLMRTYRTLDGVLAAAREGKIIGKQGRTLVEQADRARLSQQLVTLCDTLPIGTHWAAWPLHQPRGNWQDALRSLGLFATAQRLARRLSPGAGRGDEASHIEDWQPGSFTDGNNGKTGDAQSTPDAEPTNCGPISPKSGATVPTPPNVDRPSPQPPSGSAERRVYERALSHHQAGRNVASGYHPGTLLRLLWDAGLRGEPFDSVDQSQFNEFGKPRVSARPQWPRDDKEWPRSSELNQSDSQQTDQRPAPAGTLF